MAKCTEWPWRTIIRVFGACLGLLSVVVGVILIIASPNLKEFVNAVYLIIFGFVLIIVELRILKLLTKLSFIRSYAGLATFYIFLAGLILGTKAWEVVFCLVYLCMGLGYYYFACFTSYEMEGLEEMREEADEREKKKKKKSVEEMRERKKTEDAFQPSPAAAQKPPPGPPQQVPASPPADPYQQPTSSNPYAEDESPWGDNV